MNTAYQADLVITKSLVGWVIWSGDDIVAKTNEMGRDLIAAGAAARGMSVYDEEAGHFLSGTVAQLVGV